MPSAINPFRAGTRRVGTPPVTSLLGWYSAGVDVPPRLPVLSTYLGHVDPKSTYWYLQSTPELLGMAVARLDAAAGPRP